MDFIFIFIKVDKRHENQGNPGMLRKKRKEKSGKPQDKKKDNNEKKMPKKFILAVGNGKGQ